MSRKGEPPCTVPGGRHSWIDVTTKDHNGRRRNKCQGCGKETLE